MLEHFKNKYTFNLVSILASLCLISACNQGNNNETTPDSEKKDVSMLVNPVTPNGVRYKDLVFAEVKATRDITYGENTDQSGSKVSLRMNIFEPVNDQVMNRPLVVLAHGGGFAEGSKEDFDSLATSLAQSGYVAATIQYRLLAGDNARLQIAVVDAVHDMRAAVRFFTKDNQYNIDTQNIFIGGFSAGAVTALHYAYFDNTNLATASPTIKNYIASVGFTGTSGNAGASETVKGVINIAGGLFRANWVDAGEPILYSIHGTADPSYTKEPAAINDPNGDFTEGSGLIHPRANAVNVTNTLKKIEGGNHGAFFNCTECYAEIRAFLAQHL
ncbi:MAG TPA: hypothetical protein DCS93_36430 [Microscillaceae bacterium]|nr:hypothetical protein [Microscillaceae bacterium]